MLFYSPVVKYFLIMKLKSVIYLLCFAIFVAMGHILQKIVLNQGVDKLVFAFLRITAGFIIISFIVLYKKYNPVNIVKKNYRHFLILGIGFSGMGIILKLWGLQNTTAVNASFIMSLSSAAAVLFAFLFLKEEPSKKFYIFMALMIFGVYLVTTGGKSIVPRKGDMIIFGLAFLIGSMRVYGKKVLNTLTVIETAFGRSMFGAIFLLILIFIFSPEGFSTIRDWKIFLLVLSNGITFSGSILFFYAALQTEGASNSSMFALLVPLFTLVMGYFVLGETLNLIQLSGGGIILICSLFISRLKLRQANF